MNHSEGISKLAAALVKVQSEIDHAHKNALNPHFKNRYADLTEVIDTARPILNKHGIAYTQLLGYVDGVTTCETVLIHESGEWLSGTAGARMQKDDPQGVGSACTYIRRYSLAAICGIGQEDDDAEAASRPKVQPMEIPKPAQNGAPENRVPAAQWTPASSGTTSPANEYVNTNPHKGAHKDKSWKALAESGEKGREYIGWALGKWTDLTPEQRTALQGLLDSFKGSPVSAVLLQDALNRAATLEAIDPDAAARIEDVISEGDKDHMSAALDWLTNQMERKKLGGVAL